MEDLYFEQRVDMEHAQPAGVLFVRFQIFFIHGNARNFAEVELIDAAEVMGVNDLALHVDGAFEDGFRLYGDGIEGGKPRDVELADAVGHGHVAGDALAEEVFPDVADDALGIFLQVIEGVAHLVHVAGVSLVGAAYGKGEIIGAGLAVLGVGGAVERAQRDGREVGVAEFVDCADEVGDLRRLDPAVIEIFGSGALYVKKFGHNFLR